MFTQLTRYVLRTIYFGLAVTVGAATFGPSLGASAAELLKRHLPHGDKNPVTSAVDVLPAEQFAEIHAARLAPTEPSPTASVPVGMTLARATAAKRVSKVINGAPVPTAIAATASPTKSPAASASATASATPTHSASETPSASATATHSASPTPTHTATTTPTHTTKPGPVASAVRAVKVAAVLAFARAQLGEGYVLGGAGPNVWDCSGLTLMAFANVGIHIGTHSATNQYNTAAARGYLTSYANRQAGDLIFYTDGGGDMYHVAIYSGSGRMIEAPDYGKPVREVPVRDGDRVGQVARFIR